MERGGGEEGEEEEDEENGGGWNTSREMARIRRGIYGSVSYSEGRGSG